MQQLQKKHQIINPLQRLKLPELIHRWAFDETGDSVTMLIDSVGGHTESLRRTVLMMDLWPMEESHSREEAKPIQIL